MAQIVWISGGAGLLALAFALFSSGRIRSFEVTNERVNELSGIIQRGSMAFLSREYRALVPSGGVVGARKAPQGMETFFSMKARATSAL